MAASYGIITRAGNSVTTVMTERHIFSTFRTVRPAAGTHRLRRARFESRAGRWDPSPVCAAAARPGHRCCDRKYPRELGWPAANAPATAAAGALRERPATTHTRLCSARPASHWDRAAFGPADQAASLRIDTRLALDHVSAQPALIPAAARLHRRGQAIP